MDLEVLSRPRPQNFNIYTCSQEDLRTSMELSNDQFNLFKSIVKDIAFRMLPCVARTRQKPEDWDTFIRTASSHLTHLGAYAGSWHLHSYFSILRRSPGFQHEWKQKRAEMATCSTGTGSVVHRKKRVLYVGKLPAHRRILSNSGGHYVTDVASQTLTSSTCVEPHPFRVVSIPDVQRLEDCYPAPCTVCGTYEPISPHHTRQFRQLFSNAEDLRSTLSFTGVLHDRHLCMVLNWPPPDRIAFIKGLHPDRIKTIDKQRLAKLFTAKFGTSSASSSSTAAVSSPNKTRREREYDPIPKPPPEVERRITSGQAPLSEFMQAMTIQSEREFEGILETIDLVYEEHAADLDQDDKFWLVIFNKVYSKWPVMRLFRGSGLEDNNWAIKFYVRRKLEGGVSSKADHQVEGNGSDNYAYQPSLTRRSPDVNSIPDSGSNVHPYPYPGITLSTCPVHPPPDYRLASPRLRRLLESYGAEELLPAFVTVGIRTDQALNELSMVAKQDQIKVFTEARGIRLTDLQKFTLQLILNELRPDHAPTVLSGQS